MLGAVHGAHVLGLVELPPLTLRRCAAAVWSFDGCSARGARGMLGQTYQLKAAICCTNGSIVLRRGQYVPGQSLAGHLSIPCNSNPDF
eukprot:scaffold20685_cov18-Tisochrysis_lutea.AAC.2